MTKGLLYRLEFSNLRVARNRSPHGIALSGVMQNASGHHLPYDILPMLRFGGITISVRKLVGDGHFVMKEVRKGVHKYCLPIGYSESFSFYINRPDDGWDERHMPDPASSDAHHVQVEGLDQLYDLSLVLARMDATPCMPQIDTFDLDLDVFLQRIEPLLDELFVRDAASKTCNFQTRSAQASPLVFTDVTVRESASPMPSYDPYDPYFMPKAHLEVSGTVTNASKRFLPPSEFPMLVNDITFNKSDINLGSGELREVEVMPGIWGLNVEPDQALSFSYVVPENPTYNLYDEQEGEHSLYSVQSGWRFTTAANEVRSVSSMAYPGLEEVPEQIAGSLRRIQGANTSEDALFSDLVSIGWNEYSLRSLVQGGPYWVATFSESSYAYHCSSRCPTLARSAIVHVSGYYIATTQYHHHRCSVCG